MSVRLLKFDPVSASSRNSFYFFRVWPCYHPSVLVVMALVFTRFFRFAKGDWVLSSGWD
jgi:hypothetical protein